MPDLPLLAWLTLYAVAVVVILFFLFGRPEEEPVPPSKIHLDYAYAYEGAELVKIDGRLLWIHEVGPDWIVVASWPPDE